MKCLLHPKIVILVISLIRQTHSLCWEMKRPVFSVSYGLKQYKQFSRHMQSVHMAQVRFNLPTIIT
jgi:hypothetical protein